MAKILKDVGFVHLHVHSSYSLLEGALKIADLGEARGGRPAAGAGADRHQQPLRRARVFREARRAGHPADRRDAAFGAVRGAGPDSRACQQVQAANLVLLAQSEEGYGNLMRLASRAYFDVPLGDAPRVAGAAPRGARRRSDRAHRRAVGPARRRAPARRPARPRRGAARGPEATPSAIGSMSRSSATASMRSARSRRELIALADRHGLPLVAANEPFFARADDYEAHDALLAIAEGRLVSRREPAPPDARARFQDARARWPSCFATCPTPLQATRRDRDALRVPRPHRKADPAALFGRSAEGDGRSTRPGSCAGRRRRGSSSASPRTVRRRA